MIFIGNYTLAQTKSDKERIERESRGSNAGAQRMAGLLSPQQGGTCATPTIIGSLPFNDTGDTTGVANTVSAVGTGAGCGSITFSSGQVNGPDLVYQFTVGTGNNLTFTLTPTSPDPVNLPYDPAIYVLMTCGTGTTCLGGADSAGDNQAETLNVSGLAPGTYAFYVDSFYTANVRRQGPYTLNVTGTFGLGATATPTNTPTATSTPTVTPTNTPTPTGTLLPTFTPTVTPTATSTPTVTNTPVLSATPTRTNTPSPPTATPTPTSGSGPGGPAQPIPMLSGWTLGVFALSLAAAALYLARRNG
ncbi:MAG: hypothetical protein ABR610_07810 [Thermoanaerobaculia bacterium]